MGVHVHPARLIALNSCNGAGPFGWEGGARGLLLACAAIGLLVVIVTRPEGPPRPPPRLVVNLNDSPAPVVQTLPRLGPARVGAIVKARREKRFDSMDDFERRVYGVGPATRKAIEPYARLD